MARLLSFAFGLAAGARACSNILVTKGASADGRAHVSYNADDAALIGAVSRWPGRRHPPGRRATSQLGQRKVPGRDPEPETTLNVVGNANEAGVVIGETTHGGLALLSNVGKTGANGTLLDYGSLIWITLQRARTAREAVATMVSLCETYGYASDLEGLARIQRWLPCDDASACRASPDLVDFLVARGLYPADADPALASFSDAVDPVTFAGARFCEARVWDVFRRASSAFDAAGYLDYARGVDLSTRMPLWIEPSRKLGRGDVHALMSSHFEDTWFDPAVDVGAAAEHAPYRWNGLDTIVADQVYTRTTAAPTVLAAKEALDARLAARLADAEAAATALFAAGDAGAALATLLVAYVDGRVTTVDEDDEVCGCAKESAAFTDAWKTKVVADTGDEYLARSDAKTDDDGRPKTMLRSARAELPRRHHAFPARTKTSIRGVVA
ncbi:C69 peptidase-like protein [Aureococcus anophagefferens]|nr:C69 peptidase-like protein [Aureococcus anophagefferens]